MKSCHSTRALQEFTPCLIGHVLAASSTPQIPPVTPELQEEREAMRWWHVAEKAERWQQHTKLWTFFLAWKKKNHLVGLCLNWKHPQQAVFEPWGTWSTSLPSPGYTHTARSALAPPSIIARPQLVPNPDCPPGPVTVRAGSQHWIPECSKEIFPPKPLEQKCSSRWRSGNQGDYNPDKSLHFLTTSNNSLRSTQARIKFQGAHTKLLKDNLANVQSEIKLEIVLPTIHTATAAQNPAL